MTGAPALYVDGRGRGRPVLFLHGFAGSARNWRGQMRSAVDRARCVAYDARGHGRSEAPDDPAAYSIAHAVEDGWRALDLGAPGAGPALLVGLSMGAAIALQMGLQRPERVCGLLVCSLPAGRAAAARALDFAAALERHGPAAAGARFVWGPESGLDERGAALVRQGFLEHPAHALAHTLRGVLAQLPPVEALPPLPAGLPVRIVAGADDGPSLAPCRALAERTPGATLEVVPGAGHVVNLAAPAAFADQLEASLHARAENELRGR